MPEALDDQIGLKSPPNINSLLLKWELKASDSFFSFHLISVTHDHQPRLRELQHAVFAVITTQA